MFQYKALLKGSKELIAEGHTVENVENQVLHYRRQQKKGEHTNMNNPVEIIHVQRTHLNDHRQEKEVLIKII